MIYMGTKIGSMHPDSNCLLITGVKSNLANVDWEKSAPIECLIEKTGLFEKEEK